MPILFISDEKGGGCEDILTISAITKLNSQTIKSPERREI